MLRLFAMSGSLSCIFSRLSFCFGQRVFFSVCTDGVNHGNTVKPAGFGQFADEDVAAVDV